jgi:hypothetical protein
MRAKDKVHKVRSHLRHICNNLYVEVSTKARLSQLSKILTAEDAIRSIQTYAAANARESRIECAIFEVALQSFGRLQQVAARTSLATGITFRANIVLGFDIPREDLCETLVAFCSALFGTTGCVNDCQCQ